MSSAKNRVSICLSLIIVQNVIDSYLLLLCNDWTVRRAHGVSNGNSEIEHRAASLHLTSIGRSLSSLSQNLAPRPKTATTTTIASYKPGCFFLVQHKSDAAQVEYFLFPRFVYLRSFKMKVSASCKQLLRAIDSLFFLFFVWFAHAGVLLVGNADPTLYQLCACTVRHSLTTLTKYLYPPR